MRGAAAAPMHVARGLTLWAFEAAVAAAVCYGVGRWSACKDHKMRAGCHETVSYRLAAGHAAGCACLCVRGRLMERLQGFEDRSLGFIACKRSGRDPSAGLVVYRRFHDRDAGNPTS
eukprot:scaffold137101_cov18-Tisochrysis_lutea.AAC.2